MSLREAMREEEESYLRKHGAEPVPQEIIDRYVRELSEDRERYEVEERIRIARTYQLAITTVVV